MQYNIHLGKPCKALEVGSAATDRYDECIPRTRLDMVL